MTVVERERRGHGPNDVPGEPAEMRTVAKALARRDRERKAVLVKRRRRCGLKLSDIDKAFGFASGWAKDLESYDSDPTLSDLRRYEAIITLREMTT